MIILEKIRLRAGALIIEKGCILLVEFENDNLDGVHYNLPAGGLEPGETLIEAVKREAKEEACVEIEVGPVAFVYEYQPTKSNYIYGDSHSVGVTFSCKLKAGSNPRLPESPDSKQIGVTWVPISDCTLFNCIRRLIRTFLITTMVITIEIMLRNMKFNRVSRYATELLTRRLKLLVSRKENFFVFSLL